jgi:uncharacterized peroxidase-related enzyme
MEGKAMSLVELLDPGEAPAPVADIFHVVAEEYGFVPNILRAMAHCPDLLTVFVPLWGQVYSSPTIGARLRALAALGTARAQDCTYCVAHMSASARRAGLGGDEIGAVGNALSERSVFSQREALILELANDLTKDPDSVDDAMRERLRGEFSQSEIVNIVLAIGMYNLTSRFLKALDIGVEDIFASTENPAGYQSASEDAG